MMGETCGVCGGDGHVSNSFGGGEKRCPGCNGTGRRSEDLGGGLRDVTKTKPSHHQPTNKASRGGKQTWPATFGGAQLAKEVQDSTACTDAIKARLIREIIDYETSHGTCTQTFTKKIRKQIRVQRRRADESKMKIRACTRDSWLRFCARAAGVEGTTRLRSRSTTRASGTRKSQTAAPAPPAATPATMVRRRIHRFPKRPWTQRRTRRRTRLAAPRRSARSATSNAPRTRWTRF